MLIISPGVVPLNALWSYTQPMETGLILPAFWPVRGINIGTTKRNNARMNVLMGPSLITPPGTVWRNAHGAHMQKASIELVLSIVQPITLPIEGSVWAHAITGDTLLIIHPGCALRSVPASPIISGMVPPKNVFSNVQTQIGLLIVFPEDAKLLLIATTVW